ncbi:hypothetical protein NDU88_007554 [Pleurodeles waltl]|uniref:Uncharacterized protein n=1 Tax=Pleurodeles waltl TaxID=8319 RepID=A0AAV7U057_PLEWA|nr:hypothetical protein NDU88_007554 [Pleurodeles waltl]
MPRSLAASLLGEGDGGRGGAGRPRYAGYSPPIADFRSHSPLSIPTPCSPLTGARLRPQPHLIPLLSPRRRPSVAGHARLSRSSARLGLRPGSWVRSPGASLVPPLSFCVYGCGNIKGDVGFDRMAGLGREPRDRAATILGG